MNTTLNTIIAAMNINSVSFNESAAYINDTALRMSVAIKAIAEDGNEALIGELQRYTCIDDSGNEAIYLTELVIVMIIDGVTYESNVPSEDIEALLDMEEFSNTGVWENVDLPLASNNIVFALTKEEITMKTKNELRIALETVGVEMSNTEFKKTKKADLVAMLEKYLDPSKKVEIVEEPVVVAENVNVEEKKEETNMKNAAYEKLMKAVAKEIIAQTLVLKDGKMVIRDYALFYKPTKVECADYMVIGKRLWGVVAKVIGDVYGEQRKTAENIEKTLEQMIAWNIMTKVASERSYAILNPTDMSQDEKDQLNNAWKNKQIKTEKMKDEKVKVTAINDDGKTLLNQLYPCWTYRATAEQMRNTYNLSK